ncbi:Glycine betaine/proline betaine transport system ATP-binding protein ProV [Nymphon striatum]|nr:Glycine betaine/proline betaine transport system ATP-binding protein ProV [Nymphon striatum]
MTEDALKQVQIAYSKSLEGRSPAITELLKNIKLTGDDVSSFAFQIEGGKAAGDVAKEWVAANSDRVDGWKIMIQQGYSIDISGVWKIFGANADKALVDIQSHGLTKKQVLEKHGCVVGVADADINVNPGEIFCIMGLSGSWKIHFGAAHKSPPRTHCRSNCGKWRRYYGNDTKCLAPVSK